MSSLGRKERTLGLDGSVFRPPFAGQEVRCSRIVGLGYDTGQVILPRASCEGAKCAAELVQLIVLGAHCPRALNPGDIAFIALDWAIDRKPGEEREGIVRELAIKAQFIG